MSCAAESTLSVPEKVKVAVRLVVVAGGAPEPSAVSGAVVSGTTDQVWVAGVASTLPGRIDRADAQLVVAERQAGVLLRRRARGVGGAVERALEGRELLVGGEGEASRCGSASSPRGSESIVVSGARLSGAPKVTTSCGGSLPFSRLWNCCSASWFSAASRIRKPWLAPASYMRLQLPADVDLEVAGARARRRASPASRRSRAGCPR